MPNHLPAIPAAAALLAACNPSPESARQNSAAAVEQAARQIRNDWALVMDGSATLTFNDESGRPAVQLICPRNGGRLLVNVAAFEPIGSEERMTVGSGGEAFALVADTAGDSARGGVTGEGAAPSQLHELLQRPVSISYGAQSAGPYAPIPDNLARPFVNACTRGAPAAEVTAPGSAEETPAADPSKPRPDLGPCRMQDGQAIPANRLRAIGTEPFWGARIEGRCVTYSTPEDQDGTRIWTSFTGTRESGVWSGYFDDQRFVVRTRPAPGCSDGMSDNRYPIAVSLTVGGEERSGCAEPL